jgi:hypothetical protein
MGKILITGAQSDAAVSLLRSLESCGHDLLAGSSDPLGAGLYMVPAEARVLLSPVKSPLFAESLLAVARRLGVDVIIPTTDDGARVLAEMRDDFAAVGITVVVADIASIRTALDAFVLGARCAGICAPKTRLIDSRFRYEEDGPITVRPRFGGPAITVRTEADLAMIPRDGSFVAQPYLPGESCRVDVFADPESCEPLTAVAHVPGPQAEGGPRVTRVDADAELLSLARSVVRTLRLGWASTLHFTRDSDGRPKLTSVVPRFTSGVRLTVASGVLTPTWVVAQTMDEPLPRFRLPRDVAEVEVRSSVVISGAQLDALVVEADPTEAPRRVA